MGFGLGARFVCDAGSMTDRNFRYDLDLDLNGTCDPIGYGFQGVLS